MAGESNIRLRGITWNHSRGLLPMVATAQRFAELQPGVEIVWEKRSLQAFADEPLDKLAAQFDLIVLDHPWAGFLARTGLTVALDDHLPAEFMVDQAENSVGASHRSYNFANKQWALAIDAATPVASWRADLLNKNDVPQTWDQLIDLAKAGRVLFAGIPIDTLMNFYGLCSTLGEDVCQSPDRVISAEIGTTALRMLRELSSLCDPIFRKLNPIGVYEQMTLGDQYAYCPFAYGYSNYARPGYARQSLTFGDMVQIGKSGRIRSTLGGTGLAVTTRCAHREIALRYARFVADPLTQRRLFVDNGGQPGHRGAWLDDHANAITNNYFKNTLPALDRAFLRPRYPGGMKFQDHAGDPIHRYIGAGGNEADVLRELDAIYLDSQKSQEQH